MAWTTPRTWTDGELVTAAIMNAHVRDNLSLVPRLGAYKSADQSVTSSTALVDCTSMSFAVSTNQVWYMDWTIIYTCSVAGDFKLGFTFPAAATSSLSTPILWQSDSATMGSSAGAFQTSGSSVQTGALTGRAVMKVGGAFETAGTAGTVQLQFAQVASDGTPTIVKKGSSLLVYQLA